MCPTGRAAFAVYRKGPCDQSNFVETRLRYNVFDPQQRYSGVYHYNVRWIQKALKTSLK